MEKRELLPEPKEPIRFSKRNGGAAIGFLSFVLCCAVVVAVLAMSGLGGAGKTPSAETMPNKEQSAETMDPPLSEPMPPQIPQGAIPIRAFFDSSGASIRNESLQSLAFPLEKEKAILSSDGSDGPTVLVLHTHAAERYLAEDASYLEGELGSQIYSDTRVGDVVEMGKRFCAVLESAGIGVVHCAEAHGESGSLRHSYANAADCIRRQLAEYPSIRYVVDLHRDGILASDGALIRTEGADAAQVMAVVGTDGNGTEHPCWKENLALAQSLLEAMEAKNKGSCRGVIVRNASYNQELAPRMLLLEIGSAGNTLAEAIVAAERAALALADLLIG